ncbi:MAG: hypothetical protein CMG88_09885 [Marinobacter sp.]|nr:hypothetical protein [Marinobacter sp.]
MNLLRQIECVWAKPLTSRDRFGVPADVPRKVNSNVNQPIARGRIQQILPQGRKQIRPYLTLSESMLMLESEQT